MFRSFGRNIRLVLVLFITAYIAASSFILYRTLEHRSLDMLRQLSVQYTGQQHKNTLLFMNWLEETSMLISNNQVVQNALTKPEYDRAVSPILEGIRSSSGDILGIYIWGGAGGLTPPAMCPDCFPLRRSGSSRGWKHSWATRIRPCAGQC